MSRPRNVLLIIADQFRWDCTGASGNPVIQTPHLDALAADGAHFDRCFCQAAPCGPSRMCIYTSRYMCSTRSVNNMTPLMDAEENLASYAREGGYHTAILGYNDYAIDPRTLPEGDPRRTSLSYDNFLPGFEYVYRHEYHSPAYFQYLRARGYPEERCNPSICTSYDVPPDGLAGHLPLRYPAYYSAEDSECQYLTGRACDHIRASGDGWLVSVNYIKPHPPRICPAPYHEMYDPASMPPANRRPAELFSEHPYLKMAHEEPALVDERDLRETRACYYGMVSEIDACIGRLVETLKASNQWNNTLVIFTSDHGEYLGDHYLTDKAHFYDETMRVPLIVRDPSPAADASRGLRLQGLTESIDLTPTILEYLGINVPVRFQGRSVLPLVRDCAPAPRAEIHFEYDFRHRYRGVKDVNPDDCLLWVLRDDRYKYVQFGLETLPPLLFDLAMDPGEHHDLAADPAHAGAVAQYAQRMLRWRMRHEDQRMEHWAAPYR